MATQIRPAAPPVSAEERALRVDLACAYRLVAHYGWDDLVFTHLSVRVPGPEHHFLINPHALMFDEITASSLIKIDLDGRPVGDPAAFTNPAGFTIHSAIHTARADAQAVIHLHTTAGIAVAAQAAGLLPITQTAMAVLADVAYHDFEGIATDHGERARLVADIGNRSILILRNHGTLTVGETIGEAFLRMWFLEHACRAQIAALTAGPGGLHLPPPGTPEKTAEQGRLGLKPTANHLAWPALRRRMDRIDPSYRD